LVLAGIVAIQRPAWGQSDPAPENVSGASSDHYVIVEGQAGTGIPLGLYGLAAEIDMLSCLSLQAGLGVGIANSPSAPVNFAVMPRLRYPLFGGVASASLGIGVSRVAHFYRQDDELSLEFLLHDGVRVRAFGGLGFYLNADDTPAFGSTLYVGLGLGYAISPNPTVPAERSLSIGRWYGWQSLAIDVSAELVYSRTYSRQTAAAGGAVIFALGGPLVHIAHRRYTRAAISLVLRSVIPLGLAAGLAQAGSDENGGMDLPASGLAVAGAVIAAAIDDIFLAREIPVKE
jgi:hypothetical protein